MNPVSDYMLASSDDSDKMPQNAAFHPFYIVYHLGKIKYIEDTEDAPSHTCFPDIHPYKKDNN